MTTRATLLFCSSLMAAWAAAGTGCSDDVKSALPNRVVGAAGGTLTLPGGVALEIPAGALSTDVEVGMALVVDLAAANLEALPIFTGGLPAVSVSLTPHGTTFATPVMLKVPYTGDPSALVMLRLADAQDTTWESVGPIAFADGVATLQINGFSTYSLAAVKAGSCPCWNGTDVAAFHTQGAVEVGKGARRTFYDRDTPTTGYVLQQTVASYDDDDYYRGEMSVSARVYDNATPPERRCQATTADSTQQPFEVWFPGLTAIPGGGMTGASPGNGQTVDATQFEACRALLRIAQGGVSGRQVAIVASGIPSGETLTVAHAEAEIEITDNDRLEFSPLMVVEGGAYAVTVKTQPANANCTLGANASGTVGAENIVVELSCTLSTTAPPSVTAACSAIGDLDCSAFVANDCTTLLSKDRSEPPGCEASFDTVLACVVEEIDGDPPSAGCDDTDGWELAFPSPCQTEIDAWDACTGKP